MNFVQWITSALAVGTVVAMSASQALAGTCTTNNRTLPANFATDEVSMTCDSNSGSSTTSINSIQNINGSFTVFANFTGPAGQKGRVEVVNSSGVVICFVDDTTSASGPNNSACTSGVPFRWRGVINHQN